MYHRLLAEWSAGVHPEPTVKTPTVDRLNDTTIFEVVAVYWDHLDRTVVRARGLELTARTQVVAIELLVICETLE